MVGPMRVEDLAPGAGSTAVPSGRVLAVLGPTNTGKTYFAIERMLGHASGMIGFPLRLLARENYDRIAVARGRDAVALITGEEMIVPQAPRYFVCTVEAMPVDRPVAFLAVDEIQLCADAERGHIFTDRLLHARGQAETLFLGSETIASLIKKLVPRVEVVTRPRFSSLSYAGHRKLTRLPPRAAVVAFSATDVYAMAELIRRHRGGTAVVLGALSPRTRNAQVDLYQSGDVEYLVATDAIGMGLNLDIDHVAFARLSKFDGHAPRRLTAQEIGQIGGRAGRHRSDGTFGTTGDVNGIDDAIVEAVETHSFDRLKMLRWRNSDLEFYTIRALLRTLDARPTRPELQRVREADDHLALAALAREDTIQARARGREAVSLLWDVCRIPDFRKVLSDAHTRLLGQIYQYLSAPAARLPTDWVATQVARLDRTEGDIDALITRIAHVRTWTYVSHRPGWLTDARHWRDRTRAIEDKLSDALHERLTQRFVDRRSASLVKSLRSGNALVAAVDRAGDVLVEGHPVGHLDGFRFIPDQGDRNESRRTLDSAVRRALGGELATRVTRLEQADDSALHLGDDGTIAWDGAIVARLRSGPEPLSPRPELVADEFDPRLKDRLHRRLDAWLRRELVTRLSLLAALGDDSLTGAVRGIAFHLREGLGSAPRAAVNALVAGLTAQDRARLRGLGICIGRGHIFMPAMVKPRAVVLRGLLWCVHRQFAGPPAIPPAGRVSVPPAAGVPAQFYAAVGYPVTGRRAVRVDMLERLDRDLRRMGPTLIASDVASLASRIGCPVAEVPEIVAACGYRSVVGNDGAITVKPRRQRSRPATPRRPVDVDMPFAKLQQLKVAP